jgi:hypothetical protein
MICTHSTKADALDSWDLDNFILEEDGPSWLMFLPRPNKSYRKWESADWIN